MHRISSWPGRGAHPADGKPVEPVDDVRQSRELAFLIGSSDEAVETFIAHCDVAARDC